MNPRRHFLKAGLWALLVCATPALAQVTNLRARQQMVWDTVPNVVFTPGVPGEVYIGQYIAGAQSIALSPGTVLPAGVTYDAIAQKFKYDGTLPSGVTPAVVLIAGGP